MTKRKTAKPKTKATAPAERRVDVKVSAAKGRPMLTWVGKRPLGHVTAFPAQHVENFGDLHGSKDVDWRDWPAKYPKGGLLFYSDPPFDSGADYVRKVSLRGPSGTAKVDGQTYTLGEQIQYTDIWANDNYLQFMYERLLLLKEFLTKDGFFLLHANTDRIHYLKCMADEVFGPAAFRNELVWKRRESHGDTRGIGTVS